MFEKTRPGRDAYTFSLGAMVAKFPFIAAPAIADNRINKILDERIKLGRNDREPKPRAWLSGRSQTAQNRA